MIYIESPMEFKEPGYRSIFLAGGITGCPNWQRMIVEGLVGIKGLVVLNPRREVWDMSGGEELARAQIEWEYTMLRRSTERLFWFCRDTLCPIALFELGTHLARTLPQKLYVGVEPGYAREFDVREQVRLVHGNDVIVRSSLQEMVDDIKIRGS